ncbi:MAG: zf-HC2 domain-containing protein [Acidobacteriaceae bacterium]|nr:zf-HC2 domain-containing protein [Acidobacteriaceae bacterium]
MIGNRCAAIRGDFSAYLDGRVSGRRMASIARHLDGCAACTQEFKTMRSLQRVLGELGQAPAPDDLQIRLRGALRAERERQTFLPRTERWIQAWRSTFAPLALRAAGGVALASVIVAGLGWIFAAPLAVEANDDKLAHLTAPRYMYSQVPPEPIVTGSEAPVLVMAQVDENGRVFDYQIISGPSDQRVRLQVEQNLLGSVFKPATIFGEPVHGHVMLTYTGVSVRG